MAKSRHDKHSKSEKARQGEQRNGFHGTSLDRDDDANASLFTPRTSYHETTDVPSEATRTSWRSSQNEGYGYSISAEAFHAEPLNNTVNSGDSSQSTFEQDDSGDARFAGTQFIGTQFTGQGLDSPDVVTYPTTLSLQQERQFKAPNFVNSTFYIPNDPEIDTVGQSGYATPRQRADAAGDAGALDPTAISQHSIPDPDPCGQHSHWHDQAGAGYAPHYYMQDSGDGDVDSVAQMAVQGPRKQV
ncbi:hypothetical protein GQ53DRAFT_803588 [Thozetella sp. PMI_491]|nr:hypothetical protein GQ53DRAFT_803588 [Thozetella sp. PMI_491]